MLPSLHRYSRILVGMYDQTSLAQDELCALKLFKFHTPRGLSHRFYYHSPKFRPYLHKFPLTVDIRISGGSYPKSTLTIVDAHTNKCIFRKWGNSSDLVVDLIDKREQYFDVSYAYNVFRIINNFSVISNIDLSKIPNKIEVWAAMKEFEEGEWGGRDKDNKFSTYVETKYFITFNGDILNDPYLRKLLPPKKDMTNYYEEYKSSTDTKQDGYSLERVTNKMKGEFLKKYIYDDHMISLSNIL
jgi:hypothetical protein